MIMAAETGQGGLSGGRGLEAAQLWTGVKKGKGWKRTGISRYPLWAWCLCIRDLI